MAMQTKHVFEIPSDKEAKLAADMLNVSRPYLIKNGFEYWQAGLSQVWYLP